MIKTKLAPAEIIELNNQFYKKVAPFFAQTRMNAWIGWEKLPLPKNGAEVLDVAAGNLRFYKFLQSKNLTVNYLGIDACKPLLELSATEKNYFQTVDILQDLLNDRDWRAQLSGKKYDYIICSAFFHHVPVPEWRERLLEQMSELLKTKGVLVISLWQFMNDEKMRQRVKEDLGNNDFLLDWRSGIEATRFCHHFDEIEIENDKKWAKKKGLNMIDEFKADGATGQMNHYLIFERA